MAKWVFSRMLQLFTLAVASISAALGAEFADVQIRADVIRLGGRVEGRTADLDIGTTGQRLTFELVSRTQI